MFIYKNYQVQFAGTQLHTDIQHPLKQAARFVYKFTTLCFIYLFIQAHGKRTDRAPKIGLSINFDADDSNFPAEKAASWPHPALPDGTLTDPGK
jgi:hypothetical protein